MDQKKVRGLQYISVTESQITPFHTLRTTVFELQAILKQPYQMIPIWPWTLRGQRYPIYVPTLPTKFQIKIRIALVPPVLFGLQAILRQLYWMAYILSLRQVYRLTPKWPWTVRGQRILTYSNSNRSPNFSFGSTAIRFPVTGLLGHLYWMTPNNFGRLLSQRRPINFHSITVESHISVIFFSMARRYPVWSKCTDWHQKHLEY